MEIIKCIHFDGGIMTEKRFERIYADVDVFCRDHNAKGVSQLIEREDYDRIVDLLNELNDENEELNNSKKKYLLRLKRKLHEMKKQLNGKRKHLIC